VLAGNTSRERGIQKSQEIKIDRKKKIKREFNAVVHVDVS